VRRWPAERIVKVDPMLEVEIKMRLPQDYPIQDRLAEAGLVLHEQRDEADRYWNAPDRDFAKTDEALRIRRFGKHASITYKGPKLGSTGKTRTELEATLADDPEAVAKLEQILEALGYRRTAEVLKARTLYKPAAGADLPAELDVTVDDVEGVGRFVELECKAEAAGAAQLQDQLFALARRLGLTESERRSYLELLLASRAGAADSGGGR
jgi:adenylate cyclase class 2